ncbi:MAG TPA: hypothetical protein PK857_00580 [Hyphomicrobium sp.]|nr:hypothetical protein [Hyphomicrobium sp.]HRO48764.1 hypothetical protein [Hyphomicrobium sp.]
MELAVGAFSMLFGGGAAAATSAAGWAAGTTVAAAGGAAVPLVASSTLGTLGAAALTLGSTALTVLQGASTYASMKAQMAAGHAANSEAHIQAGQAELQAREHALRIQREELEKIGSARVAFAASGVNLGSAAQVENQLSRDADFERSLTRSSGTIQASQIRLRGQNSLRAAAAKAAGTAADFGIDLVRRG